MELYKYKKVLADLYLSYLEADTPLLKAKREEQLKEVIKFGQKEDFADNFSEEEHKQLDLLFSLCKKVKRANSPMEKEEFKAEIQKLIN